MLHLENLWAKMLYIQVSHMHKGQEVVARCIWPEIQKKRLNNVEPLLQYLKFLILQEGLSDSYAKSEIDEVSKYLYALRGQRAAESFLRGHCAGCSKESQRSLRNYASAALQKGYGDRFLTETPLPSCLSLDDVC